MLVMLDPTMGHAEIPCWLHQIPTRDQRAVLGHSKSPMGSPHPPGARSTWEGPLVGWGVGPGGTRGPSMCPSLPQTPPDDAQPLTHQLAAAPHPRPPIPHCPPNTPPHSPVCAVPPNRVSILSPLSPTQHLRVPPPSPSPRPHPTPSTHGVPILLSSVPPPPAPRFLPTSPPCPPPPPPLRPLPFAVFQISELEAKLQTLKNSNPT